MNTDFLKWFSLNQFLAELIGTIVVVIGGLMATAFALHKFKKLPFTFGIVNTLVIFIAPIASFLVIYFINNMSVKSLPILSPINVVANIIYTIEVENNYNVLKSLPYLLLGQILGALIGAYTYFFIFKRFPNIKYLKDPIDKSSARSSILSEIAYIAIFTAFIVLNRIIIFQRGLVGFFAYNLLNTSVCFVFLISAYKHGYFSTNFYVLIGHNILLKTKKISTIYSTAHCASAVSSYIGFAAIWASIVVKLT